MQKFTTPGPITAILGIPAGRIQFIAADRADTTVEIRPADPSKGRDVKLAGQTTAGYSDGVLRITAPAGNRILGSKTQIRAATFSDLVRGGFAGLSKRCVQIGAEFVVSR